MVIDNLLCDHVGLPKVVIVAVNQANYFAVWVEGIILICNVSTFGLRQGLKKRQCMYVRPFGRKLLKLSIFISLNTNITSGCLLKEQPEHSESNLISS